MRRTGLPDLGLSWGWAFCTHGSCRRGALQGRCSFPWASEPVLRLRSWRSRGRELGSPLQPLGRWVGQRCPVVHQARCLLINDLGSAEQDIQGFNESENKWVCTYTQCQLFISSKVKKTLIGMIIDLSKLRQNNPCLNCLPPFQTGVWRQTTGVYKISDMGYYWLL